MGEGVEGWSTSRDALKLVTIVQPLVVSDELVHQLLYSSVRFHGDPVVCAQRHCLEPDVWKQMDYDLSKIKLPTSFGDKIRGVFEFGKANEWKTWVKVRTHVRMLFDGHLLTA